MSTQTHYLHHLRLFLLLLTSCSLVSTSCIHGDPVVDKGTWDVIDSIDLEHTSLGSTIWGPRLIERNGQSRFYLLDDALTYIEYDVKTGHKVDSIDFASLFKRYGYDESSTITGIVWFTTDVGIMTSIDPTRCFLVVDVARDTMWNLKYDWEGDKLPGLWAYSNPSCLEQFRSGSTLLSGVQPLMVGQNDDISVRKKRFAAPPLVRYDFDSSFQIVKKLAMGSFPSYYSESHVRIQGWSMDQRDSTVLLAYDTSPTIYTYSTTSGIPIAPVFPSLPISFGPKAFLPGSDTPAKLRRFYYESSRAPIIKFYGDDRILRTFVPGHELHQDSIVPRDHNTMDWQVYLMRRGSNQITVYDVSGLRALNTFLEVQGEYVYLRSTISPEGHTVIYRCRLNQ